MQRRQRLRWFALGVGLVASIVSAAAVGCSLVVDTSGLAGPDGDDAAVDRGSAANDGGVAGDGAAEASTDATSAEAGKSCDATFCDDFDDGPLGATWTRTIVDKGSVDFATKFVSPPNALRARFFGADSPQDRYAMLEKDLGMGRHVRCDFSLYVSKRVDKENNDVFRIRTMGTNGDDFRLYMAMTVGSGGALAADIIHSDSTCACPQKYVGFAGFADGVWTRVTIETDFDTSVSSVALDGKVVTSAMFGPLTPASTIMVGLGGRAYSSITSDTLFDDFSCTLSK